MRMGRVPRSPQYQQQAMIAESKRAGGCGCVCGYQVDEHPIALQIAVSLSQLLALEIRVVGQGGLRGRVRYMPYAAS